MQLTCLDNRVTFLPEVQRPRGTAEASVYPVTPGECYPVVAMTLWENVLQFLVRDDWGYPLFVPAGLFDVGEWEIPPGWEFGSFPGIRASGRGLWVDPRGAAWGFQNSYAMRSSGTRWSRSSQQPWRSSTGALKKRANAVSL